MVLWCIELKDTSGGAPLDWNRAYAPPSTTQSTRRRSRRWRPRKRP